LLNYHCGTLFDLFALWCRYEDWGKLKMIKELRGRGIDYGGASHPDQLKQLLVDDDSK
jgi:hypothetical protein